MTNVAILFNIFNRPDTSKRVFEAIRKAKPKKLYISADGPRESRIGEKELCGETRKITENIDWECEVYRDYSDENLGCFKRMASAIDWFFDHEEMGIILEDDCLPNESFFRFCEEMLHKYKNENRTGMITGTNLSFGKVNARGDYFFSNYSSIWGWATWKRAWSKYDKDLTSWGEKKNRQKIKKLFPQIKLRIYWFDIFNRVYKKQYFSWDYNWAYALWTNDFLQIVPSKNLISNIGFGDSSTHTKRIVKVANMQTEELEFPLKDPEGGVVPNEEYEYIIRKNHFLVFRYFARKYVNKIKKIFKV